MNANIRSKGQLGKLYPVPCCIHEGDTPTFLGLINNGLASFMSPTYGGWGGRYVWRTFYGEPRAFWTQGGDSFPGRDNSKDTVTGVDGKTYTSDQATIWRWRTAFQNDFAARMDWTIKDRAQANHNPEVVVNGQAGKAPIRIEATVGAPVTLEAGATRDPDDHALKYQLVLLCRGRHWHSRSTRVRRRPRADRWGRRCRRRRHTLGPAGGPREPPPRVDDSERHHRPRDGHAARRGHGAHHPGGRGQRQPEPDVVPPRDPHDQAQVVSRRLAIWE